MQNPIIFIHYGNSFYLKYVLLSAKRSNPDKAIILLGDSENEEYKNLGIKHIYFQKYDQCDQINQFNKVYKLIAGKEHNYNKYRGTDFWVDFVFRRWLYISEFVKEFKVASFWTFDSDNILLDDLRKIEPLIANYDCSTQCSNMCLNGYIPNSIIVHNYTKEIINLFQDKEFIERQELEMIKHPKFAYTEMRAFDEFRRRQRVKSIHLAHFSDKYVFDDCLCSNDKNLQSFSYNGVTTKQIYQNGLNFYFLDLSNYNYIKTFNLNLSWLEEYHFRKICFLFQFNRFFIIEKIRKIFHFFYKNEKYKPISFKKNMLERIFFKLYYSNWLFKNLHYRFNSNRTYQP